MTTEKDKKKENHPLSKTDEWMTKYCEGLTRRNFIKFSAGTVACLSLGSIAQGCANNSSASVAAEYPIDSTVVKTTERMVAFPYIAAAAAPQPGLMPQPGDPAFPASSPNGGTALTWDQLCQIPDYDRLGYGQWIYIVVPEIVTTY